MIHGETDSIPLQGSIDWARNFPNGKLLVIERTGHLAHVEQPDTFFGAVELFLSGRWPAEAEDR